MMKAILKTVLGSAALFTMLSTSAMAGQQNIITVQGQGEVKVAPDTAILSIGVKTDGETVEAAQTANAQIMAAVRQVLTGFKLNEKAVKTVGYSVSPNYVYPANSQAKLVGYEVQYSLEVKVTDLSSIGAILDAVGKAGANEIGNISYTSSKADELKLEALKLAVQDARNQAEAIASASGRTLKKPLHITSQSTNYAPVMAAPANARAAGGRPVPSPTVITSDQVTVSASVTADFEF